MPILILAEFVIEQAIGIAIGVAAMAAARKAVPKLAELRNELSAKAKASSERSHQDAAAATAVGGAAIASGSESTGAAGEANLLASLSAAEVASWAPGRMRLRFREMRDQPQLAEQVAQVLAKIQGIGAIQAKPNTGSVLVTFDTGRYPSQESLLAAIASA